MTQPKSKAKADTKVKTGAATGRSDADTAPSTSRIGLVLGGGGITGFAYHATTLSVLHQLTDWDPRSAEVIVGTSAGANIGGLLRGGVPVGESLDELLTVPTNPRSMERLRALSGREQSRVLRLLPTSLGLTVREAMRGPFARPSRLVSGLLPSGSVRTDVIGDRMLELHDGWPDQEFLVTAVRLSDSERVVFGRDRTDVDVGTATEASSAIPGFFRPVWIDGHKYVDGGVHSPTNADLLTDHDLDLIVVIAPMSINQPLNAITTSNGALRLFWRQQTHNEVARLREVGHNVLLLEPSIEEVRAMGTTLMDPTRVVNVVLQSTSAARVAMTASHIAAQLDLLRTTVSAS